MQNPAAFDFPDADELLRRRGWVRRGRTNRLIAAAPRLGQYFWVDFARDATPPEFVGEHPGIVIRAAASVHDTCTVVPVTSSPQVGRVNVYKLRTNPNPNPRAGDVWAICDHLYTINLCRIRPFTNRTGNHVYPRLMQEDLQGVIECVRRAFPHVFREQAKAQSPIAAPPVTSPVHELTNRIAEATGAAVAADEAPKFGPSGRRILTLTHKVAR